MRKRIENVLSVRVSSFVAMAVSAKPKAAPSTMKLAGCSVEMPGRRITSTPTKPTTMATRRLAVILSCRISDGEEADPCRGGELEGEDGRERQQRNAERPSIGRGEVHDVAHEMERQATGPKPRPQRGTDQREAKQDRALPPHCGTTGSRTRSRFGASARTATAVAEKERRAPLIHRTTAKILRWVSIGLQRGSGAFRSPP